MSANSRRSDRSIAAPENPLPLVPDDLQAQEIASLASPLPYILQTFFPLPQA